MVEFTFQKVDGSIRVMRCTLIPAVLPETNKELRANARPRSMPHYLMLRKAWRSLRYDKCYYSYIYLGDNT